MERRTSLPPFIHRAESGLPNAHGWGRSGKAGYSRTNGIADTRMRRCRLAKPTLIGLDIAEFSFAGAARLLSYLEYPILG